VNAAVNLPQPFGADLALSSIESSFTCASWESVCWISKGCCAGYARSSSFDVPIMPRTARGMA